MSLAQEAALIDYKEDEEIDQGQCTTKDSMNESGGFRDFFLRPELIRALNDIGFERPSEVQHEAVPHAITGADVLCQAKSGMGKTAVFVLSVLHQLKLSELGNNVGCIVIAHARELAFQIKKEFDRFGKYINGLRCEVFYGGVPLNENITRLKNVAKMPHIIIGTPGRLLDLIRRNLINTQSIAHFIVDECDKCLEKLDMRKDIQEIFVRTPKVKQVLMLSATLSSEMRELCKKFMQSPVDVIVDDESKLTLHGLIQYHTKLNEDQKSRQLANLLDSLNFNQIVIFVNSVARAKALAQVLSDSGFPAICIHAKMNQSDRIEAYRKFKAFEARLMVATDLFGRGIDIERVNIVINYDMASSTDAYLHRVGRAGRFGTKGLAISFISNEENQQVLEQVQSRFEAQIDEMPETIDSSLYSKL